MMYVRAWPVAALTLLATLGTALATPAPGVPAPQAPAAQGPEVRALDGEWIYVEDRTEGRPLEQHQPSMSSRVRLRVEADAVVLVRRESEIRIPLDGTPAEIAGEGGSASRYRGAWKDGAFEYSSEPVRKPGDTRPGGGTIRWTLRPTDEGGIGGLIAEVAIDPPSTWRSVALYRHPQDIAPPTPAKAPGGIGDVAWLAGAWVGKRGTGGAISMEERWSPALGGSMLAVSRTVARERLRAFEFLRILERDAGLVYIAQPNGAPPTEFVLTELAATEQGAKRAVFENPRHDSPQRIVYELSAEGGLSASIGYARGGKPQRFEFTREESGTSTPAAPVTSPAGDTGDTTPAPGK